jgi:hypothetical protein
MREHRFRELARGKAEKDTEFPAWSEAEVLAFHDKHAAPVKTGQDLLNVISTVLSDIQHGLAKGDVTTRSLLLKASDEEEVKNWLVEQMNFRAKDRFLAYREAEIAFGDMPDTIASSTAAPVAVAFEVKHGGKSWSTNDHVKALTSQLANDYLKPIERRQGVFIISHHGNRTWLHPTTGATLNFSNLIEYLQAIAAATVSNDSGAIVVRVFGLDAAQEKPAKLHRPPPKRGSPPKTAALGKGNKGAYGSRKDPLKSKRRASR